jgi:hypothetical protein
MFIHLIRPYEMVFEHCIYPKIFTLVKFDENQNNTIVILVNFLKSIGFPLKTRSGSGVCEVVEMAEMCSMCLRCS